jgi:hypothetical protein
VLRSNSLHKLELTLDFRSLEKNAHWKRRHGNDVAELEPMFRRLVHTFAQMNQQGTGKSKFSKVFVYMPEDVGEKYAQTLEKVIMGKEYDTLRMGKFLYPNRFEYWVDYLSRNSGSLLTR